MEDEEDIYDAVAKYRKDHPEPKKVITAKDIIIDELNEDAHPEKVEHVIFWALETYAKSEPKGTWGRIISHAIVERIKYQEDKKK